MSRDLLVGIDVGTTRVKVVVVDLAGVEVAAAAVDTPWVVDGHAVEMDASVLVDAVRTVIVGGLEQCGGGDRVVGLGVTGIAESGVLLDRHGEPAAPIIAWHDQRGDVELIAKELPDLVARTGVRFDPLATIFKLPELLRRGAGVRWLNVAEWVVHSLGGAQQAEMSLSGRTGLCDLHTATWWPDALEFLGVDHSFLPGDPVFGVAGAGRASFTPIAGAHLVVAGHDHQVAAYVAGAVEPGCLFESLGTADAIAITVPAPVGAATVLATADIGATIGRTVVADRLMAMMGVRTGQILERISRLLDVGDRAARRALSERAIERAPDPDLAVELADGMVTIRGIGDDTDGAALWAAAVAATGTRTAEVIEQYAALYGPPTDVVVGGGWLNDPTIAAAVRRRFPTARRSRFGEPGAVGAACLAGISAGILDGPFAAAPARQRSLMTMSIATTPVLEARGVVKTFGMVNALQGADFIVDAGTVTALIGDNGAGKSTLVKVLSGVHPPDGGEILLDGVPVTFHSPLDAHRMGIETVYQDLALAPHLDAAANVFLGREIRRGRVFTNKRAMRKRTITAFSELGVTTVQDPSVPVALLSGGQRQSVAIARSALWAKRVIFFDEPTAALGVIQTRRVLDLIRRVRDQGLGVVLITHTLPDALEVADRVEVLRFGRRTAHFDRSTATIELLVSAITGAFTNVTPPEVVIP